MINKYIKLISLSLLTAFSISCDDKLELEPYQSIEDDQALSSPQNVRAVLVGAYDELGVDNLFGGETLMNSELLGGNGEILWNGTYNAPREIFNKQMQTVNGNASEVWLEGYETINITNNVLSALDIFDDASEKDLVEGEAKFIRGMVYFELIRFYAQPYDPETTNTQDGVPIILTPTDFITEENNVSRSSVEDVYSQILSDLGDAKEKLPNENGFFATNFAASALLARVYLTMGNFSAARDEANNVIENGSFSLTSSFSGAFNNTSNTLEDIFAIQVTSQDGTNAMNTYFATETFGGRTGGDIDVLNAHLNLYEKKDSILENDLILSGGLFQLSGGTGDPVPTYITFANGYDVGDTIPSGESIKWPLDDRLMMFYGYSGTSLTYKFTNNYGNVPILRLAEMYLIRAEANLEEGTTTGASPLEDINTLRERANAPLLTSVTLDDVYMERRLELAFEGHKIHDIKRLQGSVGNFPYNAEELVFPIPQRERNVNPNLSQNAGYN
ncbi:RagB/SusD family nutrient uptake outer membrane protein [Chondrinema litorale]|uniref:RagB/SusD family nutrient uptake outer membrane protein n=1 Tax=Chondrinema litorale TaxID=2994555 RepID=UPI002543A3AC|nr:RagB/SusD family nutrient uptake outer membrane protein [Chondrinema litorale]UZR95144.1 RagB/SusD family nutrient uptake outer membrane protein [Chondrinema litorale]